MQNKCLNQYARQNFTTTHTDSDRIKLKNIFIVRYADNFKIFCRNINDANKTYHAVTSHISGKDGKVKDETEKRLTDTQRKDARKVTKTLK